MVNAMLQSCTPQGNQPSRRNRRRHCIEGDIGTIPECENGDENEDETCNTQRCPKWSAWEKWTPCSVTCGGGTKQRQRECVDGEQGQQGCISEGKDQTTQCQAQMACPGWEPWLNWSPCSVTCEGGRRTRTRRCRKFAAHQRCPFEVRVVNGTESEIGKEDEGDCGTGLCPYWAEWDAWEACQVTCGQGEEVRERGCINGERGDLGCSNIDPAEAARQQAASAEMGTTSMRGQYAGTSSAFKPRSMHGGNQQTTTTTPAPSPTPYIAHEQRRPCEGLDYCPGEEPPAPWQPWGSWHEWSRCNATCGGGAAYRYRECQAFRSDPADWRRQIVDENMCRPDDRHSLRDCASEPCPFFDEWSPWGGCWSPDGCLTDGSANMTRTCHHGTIGQRGCEAEVEHTRERDCFHDRCAHFDQWHSWSPCSRTCSGGIHVRKRVCKFGVIGEDSGCPAGDGFERALCQGMFCLL